VTQYFVAKKGESRIVGTPQCPETCLYVAVFGYRHHRFVISQIQHLLIPQVR
jgi:hypothetical protein